MALQELSAPPPITGYAALGAQIAQAGDNYRQRAQQLQDVASQRSFIQSEGDKQRAENLQDAQTMETFRNRNAGIQILINEGYLSGADKDNPQAVADAYKRAQSDGTDKLYLDLLNTPDETGKPLLSQADKTNPAMVQAAKDKLGALKARLNQSQLQDVEAGRASANATGTRYAASIARANALEEQANNLIPVAPTDNEIRNYALRMVQATKKPGEKVSDAEVAMSIPDAKKELETQRYMQAQAERQALIQQSALIRSQTSEDQRMLGELSRQHLYPNAAAWSGGGAAPAMAGSQSLRQPTAAEAQAAFAAARSKFMQPVQPASSPVQSGQSLLDNPGNNPVIAAGNEAIQKQAQVNLQAQINSLQQDLQSIDSGLAQSARASANPTPIASGVFSNYAAPFGGGAQQNGVMAANPIGEASRTADLLKSKAAKEAQLQTLRAQLQGPTVAAVAPPSINTISFSTPTPAFAMPSGLLSQPNSDWWRQGQ